MNMLRRIQIERTCRSDDMKTTEKLGLLRKWMAEKGADICYVPSSDAHMSEYTGLHWRSRAWLTGFTGSAGTAVITADDAGLWTDGRYFIQAEKELEGSGIRLFRMGEAGVPTCEEWIAGQAGEGGRIAADGRVLSIDNRKALEKALAGRSAVFLTESDPFETIWSDRPEISPDPVFVHEEIYAGKSRGEKLAAVRAEMAKCKADYYILTAVDEICWLLNIRGSDVPYNPFVTAFALIGREDAFLFANSRKFTDEVRRDLNKDRIYIKEYDTVYEAVQGLEGNAALLYDPEKTNVRIAGSIRPEIRVIEGESLVIPMKAVKNDTEIKNIRDSYLKDATALVRLFKWIDDTVSKSPVTELEVDAKGLEFRKELPLFKGLSFGTIAACGRNAAMMHYAPKPESNAVLEPHGLFLLDSGCQFLNGTTDITRTLALGELTEEEKTDFTLTLKSLIALSSAKFLYGATGPNLDVLARMPMWQRGMDYKCGTGHGVGYFSTVHEAPQRFAKTAAGVKLEKGMVITVEPGVYKEGKHGIRTENTLLVVEDGTTPDGIFMRFETLCFLPIDLHAIVPAMLTDFERDWLNRYHADVYLKLSPFLDEECKGWLEDQTAQL